MKTYRAKAGPFKEAVYYEVHDIERICLDELRAAGFYPSSPEPIRIERFLEKKFITPSYDDLPEGVLGVTKFGSRGVEEIVISRSLSEEGTRVAERRLNTTMAHEAGHGLLHAHLFVLEGEALLPFPDGVDTVARKILCRNDAVPQGNSGGINRYDGRWREVQANQAIGALLLPKPLVEQALGAVLGTRGSIGTRALEAGRREKAAAPLTEIFDVNPRVARIRLQDFYPESNDGQLTL